MDENASAIRAALAGVSRQKMHFAHPFHKQLSLSLAVWDRSGKTYFARPALWANAKLIEVVEGILGRYAHQPEWPKSVSRHILSLANKILTIRAFQVCRVEYSKRRFVEPLGRGRFGLRVLAVREAFFPKALGLDLSVAVTALHLFSDAEFAGRTCRSDVLAEAAVGLLCGNFVLCHGFHCKQNPADAPSRSWKRASKNALKSICIAFAAPKRCRCALKFYFSCIVRQIAYRRRSRQQMRIAGVWVAAAAVAAQAFSAEDSRPADRLSAADYSAGHLSERMPPTRLPRSRSPLTKTVELLSFLLLHSLF